MTHSLLKGFNLLNHLEQLVGSGPFLAFARAYIDRFKNDGVSSGQFKDLFLQSFPSAPALDWDTLFYSTGKREKMLFQYLY